MRHGLVTAGVAALLVVAGCADGAAGQRSAPARASTTGEATPGEAPPTAGGTPGTHQTRPCGAADLTVGFAPFREGAGGHLLSLIEFRNSGASPCLLSGYPRRVTLTEPGHRPVRAAEGSFFPTGRSRPMKTGEKTSLGLETGSGCPRPAGGARPRYHEVRIALRDGVITVRTPPGHPLDVSCGVHLTTFTDWR